VTTRHTAFGAGMVGLVVSSVILTLLALGLSGILFVHQTDLMYVLWPSSIMLIVGWRTTAVGIAITLLSVVINCLLYAGIGILLRFTIFSLGSVVRRNATK
jgi:hypothetical protein